MKTSLNTINSFTNFIIIIFFFSLNTFEPNDASKSAKNKFNTYQYKIKTLSNQK